MSRPPGFVPLHAAPRARLRRWGRAAGWICGLVWLTVSVPAATRIDDLGTRDRAELFGGIANYLARLEGHIYWPAGTRTKGAPLRIGLLGRDRMGDALEKAFAVKGGSARNIEFKRAERVENLVDCDLVFMDQPTRSASLEAARGLAGRPVLLVAFEAEDNGGVAVNLVLIKGVVLSFRLDVEAMRRGGLTPSDGLLIRALSPERPAAVSGGSKP